MTGSVPWWAPIDKIIEDQVQTWPIQGQECTAGKQKCETCKTWTTKTESVEPVSVDYVSTVFSVYRTGTDNLPWVKSHLSSFKRVSHRVSRTKIAGDSASASAATPFSLFDSGWCVGARVNRPVLLIGLLCLSWCVGCCLVCVLSCWCPVLLRVCPLAGVVCFFLCCFVRFFLFVLFGVASAWLVSSWQRPPLVLPAPSVGPLGPLVQSVCSSLPPGIWLYLATARLSCLWYGV